GLDRLPGAVEDVVGDLERDPKREPERAEIAVAAAAEQAGRLEELPGLERAAIEVALHGRVWVVRLGALQRLAPGQCERRAREEAHSLRLAGRGELRERAREEVVPGRPRCLGPMRRPRGSPTAPVLG